MRVYANRILARSSYVVRFPEGKIWQRRKISARRPNKNLIKRIAATPGVFIFARGKRDSPVVLLPRYKISLLGGGINFPLANQPEVHLHLVSLQKIKQNYI